MFNTVMQYSNHCDIIKYNISIISYCIICIMINPQKEHRTLNYQLPWYLCQFMSHVFWLERPPFLLTPAEAIGSVLPPTGWPAVAGRAPDDNEKHPWMAGPARLAAPALLRAPALLAAPALVTVAGTAPFLDVKNCQISRSTWKPMEFMRTG